MARQIPSRIRSSLHATGVAGGPETVESAWHNTCERNRKRFRCRRMAHERRSQHWNRVVLKTIFGTIVVFATKSAGLKQPADIPPNRLALQENIMAKIGLFYDTDTGNTRKVAKMIAKLFDEGDVEIKSVTKLESADFDNYTAFIIGTPTLGEGELPENWIEFMPQLDNVNLSGKTVALFGLGDQEEYGHEFVDGLGLLYEKLESLGASFVGAWPTEGYEYEISAAEIDDQFVGLVIDQDTQSDLTPERVETWVSQVKQALMQAAENAVAA
jgi:flavodoxin I